MRERKDEAYDAALERQLLAANPDGLWVLDDEGITTYANENMARILGVDLDVMIGMPVFDVLDAQGRDDFSRHLPVMVATGEPRDNLDSPLRAARRVDVLGPGQLRPAA